MKHLAILAGAAALGLTAPATAKGDVVRISSPHSVSETVERLAAAVEGAGATVFAEVPHSAGAESIGAELAPMTLVIFGNPRIGTPLLQADPLTGLDLPLRVLVYEDRAGDVWLAHSDPAQLAERHDLAGAEDGVAVIAQALGNLTAAAAAED